MPQKLFGELEGTNIPHTYLSKSDRYNFKKDYEKIKGQFDLADFAKKLFLISSCGKEEIFIIGKLK